MTKIFKEWADYIVYTKEKTPEQIADEIIFGLKKFYKNERGKILF
jgi:hypothetical protein